MLATNANNAFIQFPYDISFVDCAPSPAVRFQVEQHLVKLGQLYDRITDCKVAIRLHHKHSKTRSFQINILLDLPGKRIAVSRDRIGRDARADIHSTIVDAFHKAHRQLDDFLRIRKDHSLRIKPQPLTVEEAGEPEDLLA